MKQLSEINLKQNPFHLINGEQFLIYSISQDFSFLSKKPIIKITGKDLDGTEYCVPPSLIKEFID